MLISLIHPSRSRPDVTFRVAADILNKTSGNHEYEYLVCTDFDDPKLHEYQSRFHIVSGIFTEISWHVFNSKNCVQSLNEGAKASKGNILIYVSDDFIFPTNWDEIITERTKGLEDWVLWVYDGIQKDIMTSCILDRKYYNRDKYIYNPAFMSMYADNFFTFLSVQRKKVIMAHDILIKHNHFSVGGLPNDETYQKQNDPKRYQEGLQIFNRLKEEYASLHLDV